MTANGWIGVDLDGTLAHWDEAIFPEIGPPIPSMVARVKGWIDEKKDVRIFTARVSHVPSHTGEGIDIESTLEFTESQRILVQAWCRKHLGVELPVTCIKDFLMIELWDDRCVQMITNTGRTALDVAEDAFGRGVDTALAQLKREHL